MKQIIGVRIIKTAIGATVAILLADALGLEFGTAAGVITILSIQSTKRQSIEMAIKRFVSALIALGVGTLFFMLLGYTPIMFGLFLLVFIPLAVKTRTGEGIVPASVLVTHLLTSGGITVPLLINEVLLVIIGVGVALILNLYMPSIEQKLYEIRSAIEDDMYQVFMGMAQALEERCVAVEEEKLYSTIEKSIKNAREQAYKHTNNHLFANVTVYERYFAMRWEQFQVMLYMRQHFGRIFMCFQETKEVAGFTRLVAESIKGRISSVTLLEQLEALREHFRESELPKTREEFENRAMLYQFLNDIERFLEIKQAFRDALTEKEFEEYEKGYK